MCRGNLQATRARGCLKLRYWVCGGRRGSTWSRCLIRAGRGCAVSAPPSHLDQGYITSLQPGRSGQQSLMWGGHSCIYNRLYSVTAYGNRNAGVFVMHHRGSCLTREIATSLGFEQFCTWFGALVRETLTMSEVLLHGDALLLNIVYDGRPWFNVD
jgi:hypothetical protein